MDYSIEIIDIEFLGYSNVLEYVVDTDEYKVCESTVKYNDDRTVSHVEINDNIFDKNEKSISKTIRNELKKYVGMCFNSKRYKKSFYIEKDILHEYSYSKYSHSISKKTLMDKGNMITGLANILENASYLKSNGNKKTKHIKDAPNGFAYYKVIVKMNTSASQNMYELRIVNRIDKNNRECFYDIVDIKKVN